VGIRVLGPVRVSTGEAEAGLRGHGARVLAWLALRPGRVRAADDLIDLLWPDGPPPTARTAMQAQVAKLRTLLATVDPAAGEATIETVGRGYVLHVADDAVDAHRFDRLVDDAQVLLGEGDAGAAVSALSEALDLWSGPALADVRDDPQLAVEAAALDARRADAEDHLARALVAAGETGRAVELLERLVAEDPLRERRWAQLMMALHRDGRQAAALRAYQRAAKVLAEEAGLEPGRELRRLERAILLQDPGLDAPRAWATTLAAPLVRVVGRDAERAAVRERLRSARLVTLVGPGGVGKTATALDVAAGIAPALADGAVVVDLAATAPGEVGEVVAATLGAADGTSDDPLRRAAVALSGREALLVLDNCEHVLADAAATAVALLRAGTGVRLLATSQEPLRVAGEAVVTLAPLDVPDAGAGPDGVEASGAGALLVRRLEAVGRVPATDDDWRAVGAVARATGGLPLALEVAAAWARTERLAVVAERLAGDDVLLAEPPAGAGRRGLGAALDAAAERLSPPARRAYAAAGLFPARFGAEPLGAAAGLDPAAARAAVTELADVSLAVPDQAAADRFRLLPPVRRHAAALLAGGPADGGGDGNPVCAAWGRLTAWCLATAAELDREARGPGLPDAVARFTAELPTFRAVLRTSLDDGRALDALRLFERLGFCWASSPAAHEAARWGVELLRHTAAAPPGERVRVEVLAMQAADTFEDIAAHLPAARAALEVAEEAGDTATASSARLLVAMALGWRGERLDEADELAARARADTLASGHPFWAAEALGCQGLLALRRLDVATGRALLDEALAEHRAVGTSVGIGRTLLFAGFARRFAGDLDGARRAFTEVRRLLTHGRVTTWLRATVALGHTELAAGDPDAAVAAFRAAHVRATDVGDQRIVVSALAGIADAVRRRDGNAYAAPLLVAAAEQALEAGLVADAAASATALAELLAARGDHSAAAVLFGAASAVPPTTGVRLDLGATVDAGALGRSLAEALGDRLAGLEADGRLVGLEAALAEARSLVEVRAPSLGPAPGPAPGPPGGALSPARGVVAGR
jgi:DNA-binding SARP family transcriptional activator/predicted ATPase